MDKKALGRSLYRAKLNTSYVRREAGTDEIFINQANQDTTYHGSITDRNDLEEFLATAELADSEFTAGNFEFCDKSKFVLTIIF